MTPLIHTLLDEIWQSTEQRPAPCDRLTVSGTGALPSAFPVTELATATGAPPVWPAPNCFAARQPRRRRSGSINAASLWFGWTLRPLGWTLPAAGTPAGDYETTDGWIRLHTNAPHHRRAVEQVLDPASDKGTLAARVLSWKRASWSRQ